MDNSTTQSRKQKMRKQYQRKNVHRRKMSRAPNVIEPILCDLCENNPYFFYGVKILNACFYNLSYANPIDFLFTSVLSHVRYIILGKFFLLL